MVKAKAHFFMFMDELSGFCSRLILSTCIHAGNAAGAWARIVPNNPIAFPPSMEVMHRSSDLHRGLFLTVLIVFISFAVSAESLREYHQRKCNEGNTDSCERAAAMLEGEQHADRIVELGDMFAENVDRSVMEEENKPMLKEAYFDVLDDYFAAEADKGLKKAVTGDMLNLCAEHYHDHWRNRKMWWPTNDTGEPDWSTIYYYIVEHYYGYCLRSAL